MMAAGGLVSAYGQIKAGNDASDAYNNQAKQADANAAQVEFSAAEESRRLRVIGRRAAGEISGTFGASGVRQEGSVLDVIADSNANVERDVLNVQREGRNRANNLRAEARNSRDAGRSARETAGLGAVASLFGAGGRLAQVV